MRLKSSRMGMVCVRLRVPLALALLGALGTLLVSVRSPLSPAAIVADTQSQPFLTHSSGASGMQALKKFPQLPMIFEPNQGQSDPEVRFMARGEGYGLFLTQREAVLSLRHRTKQSGAEISVLRMSVAGANPSSQPSGDQLLPGKSNYFIGNNPVRWHRDVPQFARVRYRNVYPGTDLIYYGSRGRLEYDFEVAPHADPAVIGLALTGASGLSIDTSGDLVVSMPAGDLRFQAPRVYQRYLEGERVVPSRFVLRDKNQVGFQIGSYDRSRTLVIDPVLTYSTYLGGSGNEACSLILGTNVPVSGCPSIAVDSALNAYIAGSTTSTDFPGVNCSTSLQCTLKAPTAANIFISKINSNGNAILFSTYLGGTGIDYPAGIAVAGDFSIIIAGSTTSTNFPTNGSNAAFQATPVSTNKHAFASKIDPTGHTLLYSTYLSGNGVDVASGVALDASGNAYVTGTTTSTEVSTGFPSTPTGFQTAPPPGSTIQFFLTKVNPNASGPSSVPYSTYFGGGNSGRPAASGPAAVGGGVAVDVNNNVYITGGTSYLHIGNATTDFPILNAYQGCLDSLPSITVCPTSVTAYDVFVAKINPTPTTGAQLLYSTYLGGSSDDIGYGISVDSTSAYITGSTASTDFPAAGTGVFQSANAGGVDAFLAKLGTPTTTGGTAGTVPYDYFTYLGGSATDVGLAVAVDTIQGARITGYTESTNFTTANENIQSGNNSVPPSTADAFVANIDTSATTSTAPSHFSTYLGGNGNDYGTGVAVDNQSATYAVGETQSTNFPTVSPALQIGIDGPSDAFVTKLGPTLAFTLTVTTSTEAVGVGSSVTFTYTATNLGDTVANVTFIDNIPTSGVSNVSATTSATGSGCGSANGGTLLCSLGTMKGGATATISVMLTPVAATTPATAPVPLSNSAFVGVAGSNLAQASASVIVNDFKLTVTPSSVTVAAGVPASYTATVTPTGNIPNSVSISCSSALPTGATCTETTNPIPNLSNGPASTVLIINTTARVTTTTQLWRHGAPPFYAFWFPVSGLALMGAGFRRKASVLRKLLSAVLLAGFFSLMLLLPGCSSSSTTTTTGTPAGTYLVTVSATSGSAATRTTTVTLVVQ